MSYPVEPDFALIRMGDGATTEAFAIVCGIENVTINRAVNTTDKFRRDCAKPGRTPTRSIRVNNITWSVSGSGVANADYQDEFQAVLGVHKNFKIDLGQNDGSDAGKILGTFSGRGVMTAASVNLQTGGDGGSDITIEGEDVLTWTPAP